MEGNVTPILVVATLSFARFIQFKTLRMAKSNYSYRSLNFVTQLIKCASIVHHINSQIQTSIIKLLETFSRIEVQCSKKLHC